MNYQSDIYNSLWIIHFTQYSGVGRLANRIGYPKHAPYLYVTIIVFIDYIPFSIAGALHANRGYVLFENPIELTSLFGLLFIVWTIKELVEQYKNIINTHEFELDITQNRLKNIIFIGIVAVHAANFLIFRGFELFFARFGPIIGTIKLAIIYPLLYFPIVAEVTSIILLSFLMVPYYFVNNSYPLKFDDHLNIGGLEPVGGIMKKSFYVYSTGLIILLLWIYGPYIFNNYDSSIPSPGFNVTGPFVFAWISGISLFLYGVFKLHFYMQREKRKKIENIHKEIRELGEDDYGLPETNVSHDEQVELQMRRMEIEKVRQMRTWPFTAAAQERILFSAFFPIVLDQVFSVVLF